MEKYICIIFKIYAAYNYYILNQKTGENIYILSTIVFYFFTYRR